MMASDIGQHLAALCSETRKSPATGDFCGLFAITVGTGIATALRFAKLPKEAAEFR